jgi:hypothetical protein
MNQHILKKPVLDLGALEIDIQHRLKQGKIKLLISNIFCLIVALTIIFFVI